MKRDQESSGLTHSEDPLIRTRFSLQTSNLLKGAVYPIYNSSVEPAKVPKEKPMRISRFNLHRTLCFLTKSFHYY